MKLIALAALVASAMLPVAALGSTSGERGRFGQVPGARAVRSCAAAGPFWPTMTLALQGAATAWVACKEQSRLVRLALPGGRRTAAVPLGGKPIAVAVGLGSVWALDAATLYRLNARTGRVTRRIAHGAAAAYNIWIGAGAVWVADDQGSSVLRVSPATNRVAARIAVGDGPADIVFSDARAWVVTHRDNTVYRVDTSTNAATRLAVVPGGDAAAERIALLGSGLWVTGRGLGLVELDPDTGALRRTVDVDGTGIDVVSARGALWVPVRTQAVDRTGFPTMTAVRRVAPDGTVSTVATARGRVDVHGFATGSGSVWTADNTSGFLYRLPT
jgi:hypothetical protein